MNLTIGKKLGAILAVFAILLPTSILINRHYGSISMELAEQTRTESFVFAIKAEQMQKAVIEVQQYLSDISATRGAKGYDDGFEKAKGQAEKFNSLTDDFTEMFGREQDSQNSALIVTMKKNFNDYYEMGKKMAAVYIKDGPDQGNKLMEKFDPLAQQINKAIDDFSASQSKELDENMAKISSSLQHARTINLIIGIAILLIIVVITTIITSGIKKNVAKISDNVGAMA